MTAGQQRVTCNEVWGGNRAADAAFVLPGLQGWVFSQPYHDGQLGGDVHYVSSCGTGRITRLMLADVMGHGESAAETASGLRTLMQRYLNSIEPDALATEVNQRFSAQTARGNRFATALIMTYFSPTGETIVCNAGHPPPLIYRRSTGQWSPLAQVASEEGNLPFGIVETEQYTQRVLMLEPGDVVMIYTDGLTEATDEHNEQFMVDRLLAELRSLMKTGALGELAHRLVQNMTTRGYRLDDDLTIVVLLCTERTGGAGWRSRFAGMGNALQAMFGKEPFPWPELSLRNVGGALIPMLSRVGGRKRRQKF